jgi:integrase
MTDKSTAPPRSRKSPLDRPPKPYPEFPLCAANNGRWQKKISGKIHYFGRWGKVVDGSLTRIEGDGWKDALEIYKAQADDLHAGRTPRPKTDALTLTRLCTLFYMSKERKFLAGEITEQSLKECEATNKRLCAFLGPHRPVEDLRADDFARLRDWMATAMHGTEKNPQKWGPVKLGNEIARTQSIFKYGDDNGLITKPVPFGSEFVGPSKAVLRRNRVAGGLRLFTAAEVRTLIDAASPRLKAMILLGINCAFGNNDCATLPTFNGEKGADLDRAWVRFPRPKTGIERRCPLWPETVEALRAAIGDRPTTGGELVFSMRVKRRGNAITREMDRLLHRLKINGRRGLGFYTLRHTFRTEADAQKDFPAIRIVMGHADGSIDDAYREKVDDSRLKSVTDHVRAWLYAPSEEGGAL